MKYSIYIIGPMTGYPDYNLLSFLEAAAILRHLGWEVINPGEECFKLAYERNCKIDEIPYEDYIKHGEENVKKVKAIFCLTGWEKSLGAKKEHDCFEMLKSKFKDIRFSYYQEKDDYPKYPV